MEQGGISSSDFYKIFGKEQLSLAQQSNLGVKMGKNTISSIGQADDTVLISNDLNNLFYLLVLNNYFTEKYLQEISKEKTKLQVFNAPDIHDIPNVSKDQWSLHTIYLTG